MDRPTQPRDAKEPALRQFSQALVRYSRKVWLRCALIALAAIVARAPGLHGQLIWDDHYLALENPFIKSPLLAFEAFRHHLFLESFSTHYRPVQNISYMFDYFVWNTDPYGFHLTNVVLHAGCGVLLYLLLSRLFPSFWARRAPLAVRQRLARRVPLFGLAAFFVALLWVVHPVHSAAIDYISGRADSLAFLFAIGAWLLVLRGRSSATSFARATWYCLACAAGLLALCSREIAGIWIALFLAHLLFVERNVSARMRVVACVLSVTLVAAYAGLRTLPQHRAQPPESDGYSAPTRLVLMARALGDYSRVLVFPSNLHMERTVMNPALYRSHSEWRAASTMEYLSLLGLVTAAGVLWACMRRGAGRCARVFGAAWFAAGYLPISNLISLNATVAEHWLYLPSVGALVFLTGCLVDLPMRFRRPLIGLACVAVVGLAVRSAVRSSDWADEETFYLRTIQSGGATTRVGANLAEVYSAKGDVAAAEEMFRRVLRLNPNYPTARNNLANLLHKTGRTAEAEALFDSSAHAAVETKKDYPGTWVAVVNLAHLRDREGRLDEALEILARARTEYPETWEVIRLQASLLRKTGRGAEALAVVEDFARRNWWHYGAAAALGRLYAAMDDADRAEAALRQASRLDIHDAEALNLIAAVKMRQNKFSDAVETQKQALARQPDEPQQYRILSDMLHQAGRAEEAAEVTARLRALQTLAVGNVVAK